VQTSEDLAQVTFVTAWCQLKNLREPAKLKSWLCRIARNAVGDSFRQQQRTPTANAEELDADPVAAETSPHLVAAYVVALTVMIVWTNRTQRRIRAGETVELPPALSLSWPTKVSFVRR